MEFNQETALLVVTALLAISEIIGASKLKSNSIFQLSKRILSQAKEFLSKKSDDKKDN
jgi:hypothetical protein